MSNLVSGFLNFWNKSNNVQEGSDADSSTGDILQEDAIKIVKFTWAELMKKRSEVGTRVYEEVLMKDVQLSRLFLNTKMDKQSDSFMLMLDQVIK